MHHNNYMLLVILFLIYMSFKGMVESVGGRG